MPPLRLLAGTQYFTGLQLPSLQSPMGWEIVWRKEGRALPLGGQGDPRSEGGSLWKSESGSKGWSLEERHQLGEERVFFGLGNYVLRELSTPRNSLQSLLAVDSQCLSRPCLLKSLSGPCYCMDKPSDAQGRGCATLFLLTWPHFAGGFSGCRGVLGDARRERFHCKRMEALLSGQLFPVFLGTSEAGRGAGGGFC